MLFTRIKRLLDRWRPGGALPVWHDVAYRLPISAVEGQTEIEPRRADYAAWFLLEHGALRPADLRTPRRIPYADLARVHSPDLLESLTQSETLARVFAADPSDVPVDEVLHTVRLACGGTVAAARESLERGGAVLNLLGGFHHASPTGAGGLCAVNDVAVAVAVLRADGFAGRVAVLDLDAHPPDGTAGCFAGDASVWIGSLSGCDWGPLPGVDETVLPAGCDDAAYLAALDALLGRMPRCELAFVLAGGDILAGDRLGRLGLTLAGARRRDLRVADALRGRAAVWLPAGGRHPDAWKVLAGTGLVLARGSLDPIPTDFDPMRARFTWVAQELTRRRLSGAEPELSSADLEEDLGIAHPRRQRLLGFYTAHGIEYGLFRLGILAHIERLGYEHLRVEIDVPGPGERARLLGSADGSEHVLVEMLLERRHVAGSGMLFVHWLSLRNPRARFSARLPQLPGQDVPGLGLAREAGEMLRLAAQRLDLAGVAFRPTWYHVAYAGRHNLAFVDAARQGRFEALVRDLAGVPLLAATLAVAEGRVGLNGAPYAWEADEMVAWLQPHPVDEAAVAAERARCRFTFIPRPATSTP